MRTQLQLQGIVFILFGMLLALISMADPWVPVIGNPSWILLVLALIMGIIGVALSLSKDNSDKR